MIGSMELLVIMGLVLILFGGKKLPEFAKNLGKGIYEFKKACQGNHEEEKILNHDDDISHGHDFQKKKIEKDEI